MKDFLNQALQDINDNVYTAWSTLEILEEGKYYYNFMFIGPSWIQADEENINIKVLDIYNVDFLENNKTYIFTLNQLVEYRAFFLEKQKTKIDNSNILFANLETWQ